MCATKGTLRLAERLQCPKALHMYDLMTLIGDSLVHRQGHFIIITPRVYIRACAYQYPHNL